MDSLPSQQQAQPQEERPAALPQQFASRTTIRHAVHHIVRRLLLQRLAELHRRAIAASSSSSSRPRLRLCKADRTRAQRQARLLEDILYRRAACLEEYQDLETLEERVFKAGRAVYVNIQRREMERESERRVREGGGGGDREGVGGESVGNAGRSRRVPLLREGRVNGRIQRSESL